MSCLLPQPPFPTTGQSLVWSSRHFLCIYSEYMGIHIFKNRRLMLQKLLFFKNFFLPINVLSKFPLSAIYCCVINHAQALWLITTTILFAQASVGRARQFFCWSWLGSLYNFSWLVGCLGPQWGIALLLVVLSSNRLPGFLWMAGSGPPRPAAFPGSAQWPFRDRSWSIHHFRGPLSRFYYSKIRYSTLEVGGPELELLWAP